MSAAVGQSGLAIGALGSLFAAAALLAGLRRRDARLLRLGRRLSFAVPAGAVVAVLAMEWAMLQRDFGIQYVVDNVARATPTLFTVTALWASLEGSILLWLLVLGGYLAWTATRFRARETDPLVAWALVVMLGVALFFFVLTLVPANPFAATAGPIPPDGRGPNPLLQNHPLMLFHPPILYLGYVGFTVPFAFAIAALVTGRVGEGWLAETRRASLVAWGFLTLGIALGAWWSYEVLGWGGFWAWDPVENASFLPWLTGTAYLHSVMVQERRGMLRVWNLSLLVATFCLTIFGTFLTRSGVVNSVHAFTESAIGPWLLAFLALCAIVSIGLIAWRGDRLRSPGRIDGVVSRESAFLLNNLLFAAFAAVVLLGTTFPLLTEALQDRRVSVGTPYFNRMTGPIALCLLFLMAIAPLLPWRAASEELLRRRVLGPAWVGVATMAVTVLLGARGWMTVLAYGLAGFALAGIVRTVAVAVRARRRQEAESWAAAAARTARGNPRLYGGLVVHAGVVLVAVAFAAFSSAADKRELTLAPGESARFAGYTFTNEGVRTDVSGQKTTASVRVRVERGGDDLGVWAPAVSTFPNSTQGIGTPSVRTGLRHDVYLTVDRVRDDEGRSVILVAINPMILWLWVGAGLMVVGTGIALLPGRRRRPGRATGAARAAPARAREEVPVG